MGRRPPTLLRAWEEPLVALRLLPLWLLGLALHGQRVVACQSASLDLLLV